MILPPRYSQAYVPTIPMMPAYSSDVAQTAVDTVRPPARADRDRGRYSIVETRKDGRGHV